MRICPVLAFPARGSLRRLAMPAGLVAGLALLAGPTSAAPPAAKSPFADLTNWSLAPVRGSAEKRLDMRAERQESDPAPGTENIIVFGKRMRRAPIESELIRHDDPGAESWQSEASRPVVPGMGDDCSYKSGCFDKSQPGLLSTIPSLFGDH